MFDELKEVKYLAEITDFKNLMMYIEIYIIRQYWNFQSKAKLEQIIAIVITHSVFLFKLWWFKDIFKSDMRNSGSKFFTET